MDREYGFKPAAQAGKGDSGIAFEEKAVPTRFLLGGIGTGNISVDQRGG